MADVALSEGAHPMIFAVRLSNDGDAVAEIDAVRLRVLYKTLLFDDDAREFVPPQFDHSAVIYDGNPDKGSPPLGPGQKIAIKNGQVRDVIGNVVWHVGQDAPPMLAIVAGQFQAMNGNDVLAEREPLIIVLESRPGAIDAVRQSTTANADEARAVLRALRAIDGKRSQGFAELIESIESVADGEI